MSVLSLRAAALVAVFAIFVGLPGVAAAFDVSAPFKVAALDRGETPLPRARHEPVSHMPASGEPFGLETRRAPPGNIAVKWWSAWGGIALNLEKVRGCRAAADTCTRATLAFNAIVDAARAREGRGRIGEINRAVNLAIRPTSDEKRYGVPDFWAAPLATLESGEGDCEDYAIVKYAALREAGFAEDDLRLLVIGEKAAEAHAVVSVRFEGRWLILDNRHLAVVEDTALRARPLFALSAQGVAIYPTYPGFAAAGAQDAPVVTAANRSPADSGSQNWQVAPLLM
jgi:predicted transglutaminase-like cysteine proteinase